EQCHRQGKDELGGGIRVKDSGGGEHYDQGITRRTVAVQQVAKNKDTVQRGRGCRVEHCTRMQEPGGRDSEEQERRPPVPRVKELLERECYRHRAKHRQQRRGRTRDRDRDAEQRNGQGVRINRDERIDYEKKVKIERKQSKVGVVKAVCQQVARGCNDDRLIGKEIDREFIELVKPRERIDEHGKPEQDPGKCLDADQ